jgi:hypothetical protein
LGQPFAFYLLQVWDDLRPGQTELSVSRGLCKSPWTSVQGEEEEEEEEEAELSVSKACAKVLGLTSVQGEKEEEEEEEQHGRERLLGPGFDSALTVTDCSVCPHRFFYFSV